MLRDRDAPSGDGALSHAGKEDDVANRSNLGGMICMPTTIEPALRHEFDTQYRTRPNRETTSVSAALPRLATRVKFAAP